MIAPADGPTRSPLAGVAHHLPRVGADSILVAVIAVLLVAGEGVSRDFLSGDQLSTTVLLAAPLGVLAAGQTLVVITGGIDLSVATTATAAAYMMAALGGRGAGTAILAGLAVGAVVGLANGVGVGIFGVQPLIMTLGIGGVETGLLSIASENWVHGLPVVPGLVNAIGSSRLGGYVPENLVVWVPVGILMIAGLRWTGYGRLVFAVGDNALACRLAGVRVWQVLVATYAITGVLSAVAGMLLVGYTNAADLALASPLLLPSIAAVVIGGTSVFGGAGSYRGTILGALILTILDSLLTLINAPEAAKQITYGAILAVLAALYVRGSRTADV